MSDSNGISGLVVEYNVAIVVTRVRFPADAVLFLCFIFHIYEFRSVHNRN